MPYLLHKEEDLPPAPGMLWLPTHTLQEIQRRRMREVLELAKQKQLEKDSGYIFERERAKKDTKPFIYSDRSDIHRPVFVIGAKTTWYNDLKEQAMRLKEKPDPRNDPDRGKKRNPKEDVYVALDRAKRQKVRRTVITMKGNPLAKEI